LEGRHRGGEGLISSEGLCVLKRRTEEYDSVKDQTIERVQKNAIADTGRTHGSGFPQLSPKKGKGRAGKGRTSRLGERNGHVGLKKRQWRKRKSERNMILSIVGGYVDAGKDEKEKGGVETGVEIVPTGEDGNLINGWNFRGNG